MSDKDGHHTANFGASSRHFVQTTQVLGKLQQFASKIHRRPSELFVLAQLVFLLATAEQDISDRTSGRSEEIIRIESARVFIEDVDFKELIVIRENKVHGFVPDWFYIVLDDLGFASGITQRQVDKDIRDIGTTQSPLFHFESFSTVEFHATDSQRWLIYVHETAGHIELGQHAIGQDHHGFDIVADEICDTAFENFEIGHVGQTNEIQRHLKMKSMVVAKRNQEHGSTSRS